MAYVDRFGHDPAQCAKKLLRVSGGDRNDHDPFFAGKHRPDQPLGAAQFERHIAVNEKHVAKGTTMNTDDALAYYHMSKEFGAHGVVNHSKDEYVSKDGTVHIQSAEAFFAILKRGVMGSFHSVSEHHLQRYVDEFAFRWNHRSALGIEDTERAAAMVKGGIGRRLKYRQPDKQE